MTHPRNTGTTRRERGQAAIEYLGFLPLLLIVGMAAIQLGVVAYTAQQAGTAARAAARTASHDQLAGRAEQAGKDSVSAWVADRTRIYPGGGGFDEVTMTAEVRIPELVPGWHFDPIRKSATMPRD